jgi:hypothetical protein
MSNTSYDAGNVYQTDDVTEATPLRRDAIGTMGTFW